MSKPNSSDDSPPSPACEHCGGARCEPEPGGEFRCTCGNLLARAVADGLELKCRRCKRSVVVHGTFRR